MGKLKKPKKAKASRLSGGGVARVASSLGSVISGATAKRGGGGRRRRTKSPTYWANKVLVAKLKKKYYKIQYGGRL